MAQNRAHLASISQFLAIIGFKKWLNLARYGFNVQSRPRKVK